ncbi:MAG: TetR/AcrR family transcriptional regulator [Clostridium sp.]
MPLERFYRLSEEKQKAIHHAAMKEFARVPIDKVSINKIIKEADISRGSFYTYFEDKWDILHYIFEDGQKQMNRFCIDNLEENQGNVWVMLMNFLDCTMGACSNNETFEFIRNVMMHSSSEDMFNGFSRNRDTCVADKNELEQQIFEKADKSGFKNQGFEEFHYFLVIAMSSMALGMREFYRGGPKEKIREEFKNKLKLLQYGVCTERQEAI